MILDELKLVLIMQLTKCKTLKTNAKEPKSGTIIS